MDEGARQGEGGSVMAKFVRRSGYGPIVKVPPRMTALPSQIAVVDLRDIPPSVRWEDPIELG